MPFPSPPWSLTAQMWLSVFAVRDTGRPDRPAGVYGAAFVDYQEDGVLAYHELLVARLHDAARRRVRITDIWVDSVASRDGGRALWAIPKQLADLPLRSLGYGPATRTAFGAVADGQHVASGTFVVRPGSGTGARPAGDVHVAGALRRHRGRHAVRRLGPRRPLPRHLALRPGGPARVPARSPAGRLLRGPGRAVAVRVRGPAAPL